MKTGRWDARCLSRCNNARFKQKLGTPTPGHRQNTLHRFFNPNWTFQSTLNTLQTCFSHAVTGERGRTGRGSCPATGERPHARGWVTVRSHTSGRWHTSAHYSGAQCLKRRNWKKMSHWVLGHTSHLPCNSHLNSLSSEFAGNVRGKCTHSHHQSAKADLDARDHRVPLSRAVPGGRAWEHGVRPCHGSPYFLLLHR